MRDKRFSSYLACGGAMMKRKHYTEEQIISILKEHEASISVPERPSAGRCCGR
jgi:hypothetical protein